VIKKKLRGGAETSDPRLDRVPWFDVRSLNWPVSALFPVGAERVPKVWDCGDHLDQGAEGACTGYAVAHELIAKPKAVKGITSTFAREDLYWEAQKIDPFEGGAYPGAEPFMEGSTVLAAAKVAQRLGYITEYRWAFGLDDLILSVGHLGPAILGVSWFEGMMTPAKDGQIRATGARVGGHAILCKGVRTKRETFVLHNSWGTDWGNGGDCHISWEDMDKLLKDNGEACIPLVRVKNPDVG
jgi:hypothetical protein